MKSKILMRNMKTNSSGNIAQKTKEESNLIKENPLLMEELREVNENDKLELHGLSFQGHQATRDKTCN